MGFYSRHAYACNWRHRLPLSWQHPSPRSQHPASHCRPPSFHHTLYRAWLNMGCSCTSLASLLQRILAIILKTCSIAGCRVLCCWCAGVKSGAYCMVLLLPALHATAISRCLLEPATVRMGELLLLLLLEDQLQPCGIRQSATNQGSSLTWGLPGLQELDTAAAQPCQGLGWLLVYNSPVRVQVGCILQPCQGSGSCCASLQVASSSCYHQG